jgi:hypothetical protein
MSPFKKAGFHPDQIDTTELEASWRQVLFGERGELVGHLK